MSESVGPFSAFCMPDQSFCQRDIDKIQRTRYGMVSHRIAVSSTVIPAMLAYHKHTGTGEAGIAVGRPTSGP
jgi:hypothetical protein